MDRKPAFTGCQQKQEVPCHEFVVKRCANQERLPEGGEHAVYGE